MAVAGPYGHPFHPVLVPVPIGAWIASLAFDVGSRVADNPDVFGQGAYWLVILGIVGALAAAVFGFLDLFAIPTGTRAFRNGLTHMSLNLVVVGLFAVSALIRHDDHEMPGETSAGLIALSIVALALLGAAGWIGGRLAYRYGVRVADEATQADGFTDDKTTT
jgi:uncharacterized membrane protein